MLITSRPGFAAGVIFIVSAITFSCVQGSPAGADIRKDDCSTGIGYASADAISLDAHCLTTPPPSDFRSNSADGEDPQDDPQGKPTLGP